MKAMESDCGWGQLGNGLVNMWMMGCRMGDGDVVGKSFERWFGCWVIDEKVKGMEQTMEERLKMVDGRVESKKTLVNTQVEDMQGENLLEESMATLIVEKFTKMERALK